MVCAGQSPGKKGAKAATVTPVGKAAVPAEVKTPTDKGVKPAKVRLLCWLWMCPIADIFRYTCSTSTLVAVLSFLFAENFFNLIYVGV